MNNFFGNLSVMPFLKRGDRRGVTAVGRLDIGCFDLSCIAERRVFLLQMMMLEIVVVILEMVVLAVGGMYLRCLLGCWPKPGRCL